jgi:hypothetical protein
MFGPDNEIDRQNVHTLQSRNVEKNTAPENRLDCVDREAFHAVCIALKGTRVRPAVQFAMGGKMTERVDVCAHVSA